MTAADIIRRAREITDAAHAIPETTDNYREVRRLRVLADNLALDAAALGEPAPTIAGED